MSSIKIKIGSHNGFCAAYLYKGTTSTGASDVYEYFKKDVFSNPKPVDLIKFLLGFGMQKDDIVMDFFSGSATTAEAVYRANLFGCNYHYILVQLPENIEPMLKSPSVNAKRIAENPKWRWHRCQSPSGWLVRTPA